MDIVLYTHEKITGVKKIESPDDITKDCRLFYELVVEHNKKTGVFKEIEDPLDFKASQRYHAEIGVHKNLYDPGYIEHHNFVIKTNDEISL